MTNQEIKTYWNKPEQKILEHWLKANPSKSSAYYDTVDGNWIWKKIYIEHTALLSLNKETDSLELKPCVQCYEPFGNSKNWNHNSWIYVIIEQTTSPQTLPDAFDGSLITIPSGSLIVKRIYEHQPKNQIESISQLLWNIYDNTNRLVSTAYLHQDQYGIQNSYVRGKGGAVLNSFIELMEWWLKDGD